MDSPFGPLVGSVSDKEHGLRDAFLVKKLLSPICEPIERFCAGDEVMIVFEVSPSVTSINYLVDHGFLVIGHTARFDGGVFDIYHKH